MPEHGVTYPDELRWRNGLQMGTASYPRVVSVGLTYLQVTKLLREQILSHYYINWSINQLYILLVLVIGQSINHF